MNEEAFKAFWGDLMLRAMNNKAEILALMHGHMNKARKIERGMQSFVGFCERVEAGESDILTPRATAQMIRQLAEAVEEQARFSQQLACFAMVYGLGNTYDGDAAHAANKFGRGDEALKTMFRNKFGEGL